MAGDGLNSTAGWCRVTATLHVAGVSMNLTELAARLGEALHRLGAQVTTAESCTGGGIAEAITRIAGSSASVRGGLRHLFQRAENPPVRRAGGAVRSGRRRKPRSGAGDGTRRSAEQRGALRRGRQRRRRAGRRVVGKAGGDSLIAWADGPDLHTERYLFSGDRRRARADRRCRPVRLARADRRRKPVRARRAKLPMF